MMSREELRRAIGMWGIAACVLASAAGWMFMRFGMAWSIGDLPESPNFIHIVPAYIVGEVAMIPAGGKLTDRLGTRKLMLIAPFIYIIGAMLCTISVSVDMLIVCRFIQGVGAGLILGLAFSSVGKYYVPDKRGKANELMTAAFAIGSLFGTAFGYFLTDNFGWRSGFIVLSGIMLVGFIMAWKYLPEHDVDDHFADIPGLILAAIVFAFAAMYTQAVNVDFDLFSLPSLLMVIGLAVSLVLLMVHCRRSKDPAIPVRITGFEKKIIFLMFMFSLCGLGLIQYFFKLYLTYYEFNVYKASFMFVILIAGAALPSMIGSSKVFDLGCKPLIVCGSILVTLALMLTNLIADTGVVYFGISLFVFGVGLGFIVTELLCSLQSVVPEEHMGQHTGNLMGVRMVAILTGNALVGTYISQIIDNGKDHTPIDVANATDIVSEITKRLTDGIAATADSLDAGFMMTVIIMAMALVVLTALVYTLGSDDKDAIRKFRASGDGESGSEEE